MGRTRILTAEELIERKRRIDAGLPPQDPEVHKLQKKVKSLELQVKEPGELTPADIREGISQVFKKYGVEPAEEVVKILLGKQDDGKFILSAGERAKFWLELLQYTVPKLRSVEHSGTIKSDMTVNIIKYGSGEVVETRKITMEDDKVIDVETK